MKEFYFTTKSGIWMFHKELSVKYIWPGESKEQSSVSNVFIKAFTGRCKPVKSFSWISLHPSLAERVDSDTENKIGSILNSRQKFSQQLFEFSPVGVTQVFNFRGKVELSSKAIDRLESIQDFTWSDVIFTLDLLGFIPEQDKDSISLQFLNYDFKLDSKGFPYLNFDKVLDF